TPNPSPPRGEGRVILPFVLETGPGERYNMRGRWTRHVRHLPMWLPSRRGTWLMYRGTLLAVSVPLLLAAPARADNDKDALGKASLALQEAIQHTIRTAEPAIACILVSRSDAYQRHGQGPAPDNPGKLGSFDPDALDRHLRSMGLPEAE